MYPAIEELLPSPSFKKGSYFFGTLLTTNLFIHYLKRLPMKSFADALSPVIGLLSVNLYKIDQPVGIGNEDDCGKLICHTLKLLAGWKKIALLHIL